MKTVMIRSTERFPIPQFQFVESHLSYPRRNGYWTTISFIAILLTAASRVPAATDQASDNMPPVVVEILPVADQMEFAESLESAAEEEDAKALNALIDWNHILEIATAGKTSAAVNRARSNFRAGFLNRQKQQGQSSWADAICRNSNQGGTFKFLRLRQIDNQPVAIFRLKTPNQGGVNYHQYFLKRSDDGVVRARDIYIFTSAERISETIRRIWLPVAAEASKTIIDKLTKPVDPLIASMQSLPEMQQLIRDGQYEKALEIYRKLPEAVQKQKVILLIRLHAAQEVSDEEYASAIEDFRKQFPTDQALDFILIDGYYLKKDFDKALECIDRTNKNIDGDAWLISLRGSVLAELGRFEEARDAANEAIRMEPDLEDAYWAAITVSLAAKNYDETVTNLTLIESELGTEIGDLTQIPLYAEFVKSPHYAKWIESRK